jgi:hypothetical protein
MPKSDEDFQGLGADGLKLEWYKTSENAYGAFISTSIAWGLQAAVKRYALMVAISASAQGMFCLYLFGIIKGACKSPEGDIVSDEVWTCISSGHHITTLCNKVGFPLHLFAIVVYLLMMFNNIIPMYKHTKIVLHCKVFQLEDDDETANIDFTARLTGGWRYVAFAIGVGTEICTWFSLILIGILFLFKAPSNEGVIRSTVALGFIGGIDELFWTVLVLHTLACGFRSHTRCERAVTVAFQKLQTRAACVCLMHPGVTRRDRDEAWHVRRR